MKLRAQLILHIALTSLLSCQNNSNQHEQNIETKEPQIVSFHNQQDFDEFRALNLDSVYTNLLDPRNVTTAEFEKVYQSWSTFHTSISDFIKEENFKWSVSDSSISVVTRIYFDESGTIDYYFFNVLNSSVPDEKKEEFGQVLAKFSANTKIDLNRDEQFAQCGKVRYLNN